MKVLISADQIQTRVEEIAHQVSKDYQNTPLTIVGVLTGSLMFLADLVRHLEMPLKLGFIQASSYRGTATSPGELKIGPELMPDVRGHHVLLIDDILDTGQTLSKLNAHFKVLEPASFRQGVLLRKKARQQITIEPDYCGFDIPDKFVVGYGLDFNDLYRNLPYIGELSQDEFES